MPDLKGLSQHAKEILLYSIGIGENFEQERVKVRLQIPRHSSRSQEEEGPVHTMTTSTEIVTVGPVSQV